MSDTIATLMLKRPRPSRIVASILPFALPTVWQRRRLQDRACRLAVVRTMRLRNTVIMGRKPEVRLAARPPWSRRYPGNGSLRSGSMGSRLRVPSLPTGVDALAVHGPDPETPAVEHA